MKNRLIILVASLVTATSSSQLCAQIESPYKTNLYKDGAWILGSLGLSAYGLSLVSNKDDLTVEELANLNENDIWKIDRWAAGNNSEYSSKTSDIPFFISYALPFAFVINKESRHLSGQLGVMYLESCHYSSLVYHYSRPSR